MKMLTALNSIDTYLTMANFTNSSPKLAQALAENGAVRLLTLNCGEFGQMAYVVRFSLRILYNISCNHGMKQFFYDNKTAETIMPFLKSENKHLCILATLLILNIVDEEEYTSRISETGTVHSIVTWIEKALNHSDRYYEGFTPEELTNGLNKLAVNDSNKMMILDEGALPLFLTMLLHDDVQEQTSAARVIGTLAFDNEVRIKIIVFPDIVAALKECTDSTNKSLQINASGALSVIGGETDVTRERQRFLDMTTQEKRQYYKCGNDFLISQQIPSWQDTGQVTTAGLSKSSDGHFDPDAVINDKVALWRGDITRLEIDVIVKSTSVHEVIRMNGGPLIDYELTMVERQEVGGGIAITSGYFLPAKFVIHTSGPLSSSKDEEEEVLGRFYTNALDAMKENCLRTMAIPFVPTRGKGLKEYVSAKVALKTTRRWLEENHSHVDKIVFCIYDDRNWQAYQKIMPEIFPVQPSSGPKLATLPAEIIRMDDQSIQLYKKALSEGETSVHSIRVMVVGHYGVGKTTLTRRILEEDVDLDKRDSTNGIDVHVRRCRVSLADQSWTVLEKDEKVDTTSKEVAKVLIKDLSKQSRNEEPVKSEGLGEEKSCDEKDGWCVSGLTDHSRDIMFSYTDRLLSGGVSIEPRFKMKKKKKKRTLVVFPLESEDSNSQLATKPPDSLSSMDGASGDGVGMALTDALCGQDSRDSGDALGAVQSGQDMLAACNAMSDDSLVASETTEYKTGALGVSQTWQEEDLIGTADTISEKTSLMAS